ncbi:MAG: hypothetical protein KF849_10215 [Rhizobiaceae bacterium]|nr:hypothetical protein [Rhizobiaceae bacterium]
MARAAVLAGTALATPALAQDIEWGGQGATTSTPDYTLTTNWAGGIQFPGQPGETGDFSGSGSSSINIGQIIAPSQLRFESTAVNYSLTVVCPLKSGPP